MPLKIASELSRTNSFVKTAVINLFASIVTWSGLVEPLASPCHPLKKFPKAGVAVKVTVAFCGYENWFGLRVTNPPEVHVTLSELLPSPDGTLSATLVGNGLPKFGESLAFPCKFLKVHVAVPA